MKHFKRILSLMLSCSIAGLSAVSPSVSATDRSGTAPVKYDSIKREKSKDPDSADEPFKVFEIYNAYYGITTTTTAKATTTTTTTTKPKTTVTTTATKKTTAKTTAKTTTVGTTAKTTTQATVTSEPFTTSSEQLTTTEITTTAPEVSPLVPFYKGIDVSQYQGNIDWQAVKDSGVDFVIIRAGYGKELNQVDPTFYRNIEGAEAVGLDVGIYWYSYADNSETAKREAEVCYETIKNYSLDYPVYFDIEETKHANMSIAQTSAIVDTFCTEMQNRGYFVGVYSYANFLQSHIYRSVLEKYDVWVAQYSENLTAYNGHYSVWQYSSSGEVNGIGGRVDMNYCYKDYSQVIPSNPNPNFIPPETTATVPAETTTTTTVPKVLCDIVDVSKEPVNWETVSCEVAMLSTNMTDDENLINFGQSVLNIPSDHKIGVIWRADTTDKQKLAEDAEYLHTMLDFAKLEYPVYLDLTSPVITESELTADEISELIRAFCSVFDADAKHYIAIRGYDDLLTDRVNADIYEAYDVWLVTDDDTVRFGYKYGVISRLISKDDISYYENECLRNYPAIMLTYHLNGF